MGIDLRTRSSEGWSEEEEWLLSNIPHVTGALSILGSAFIVYDVASDRNKWFSTYHRLMFGMGSLDFVGSCALALSTLPMPAESGKYSFGNSASCSVQGFFVQLNIGSPLYNLTLSIYFLLVVTYKWRMDDIRKKVEIWLHLFPLLWAFVTSLVGLTQKSFNDSAVWCWIAPAPTGCVDDPYIECDRCPYFKQYRWVFYYGPLWVAMVGIMIATGILVNSVRKTEKNAAKWRPSSVIDQVEREGRTPRANAAIIEERRKKRKARRMTRAVTAKAIKYNSVMWLTFGSGTIIRAMQMLGKESYFWLMLLFVAFVPMQGFFNCIVYAEPRLQQWRKDRKDARSRSRRVAERSERQHRVHSDDSIVVERASGDDDSDDDDDFDVDDVRISLN